MNRLIQHYDAFQNLNLMLLKWKTSLVEQCDSNSFHFSLFSCQRDERTITFFLFLLYISMHIKGAGVIVIHILFIYCCECKYFCGAFMTHSQNIQVKITRAAANKFYVNYFPEYFPQCYTIFAAKLLPPFQCSFFFFSFEITSSKCWCVLLLL